MRGFPSVVNFCLVLINKFADICVLFKVVLMCVCWGGGGGWVGEEGAGYGYFLD